MVGDVAVGVIAESVQDARELSRESGGAIECEYTREESMDGGRRRKGYLCKGRRGRIKAERIGEMDEVLWPAADRADGRRPPGKPRRWPLRSHIARASSHMRLPAACFRTAKT